MAIDGIDKARVADVIQRVQQAQDLQEAQEVNLEKERAKEQKAASHVLTANADKTTISQVRSDQAVQDLEESKQTGVELHAHSVITANEQQDRAESWQQFSASEEERVMPTSLDAKVNQAREVEASKQQENSISAAELIKHRAIQSGKINS